LQAECRRYLHRNRERFDALIAAETPGVYEAEAAVEADV
jgi:hypothetical protein